MNPAADLVPVGVELFALSISVQPLQRFIELADDLFFGDSHVALKPLYYRIRGRGYRISQLGFATHPGEPSTSSGLCIRAAKYTVSKATGSMT